MGRIALPVGTIRVQVYEVPGRPRPWCVRVLKRLPSGKDQPKHSFFATQAEADSTAEKLRARVQRDAITIETAITKYGAALRASCQPTSAHPRNAESVLLFVLADHLHRPLIDFTADEAEEIFDRLTGADGQEPRLGRTGKKYGVETLITRRAVCVAFFNWARKRKYLPRERANPLKDVEITGARKKGNKPHLNRQQILDLFLPALRKEMEQGMPRAIFFGVQFYGGCRPSEVRLRTLDDVERDGSIFNIPDGKTENAKRKFPLGPMAPYMAAYCAKLRAQGRHYLFSKDGTKPYCDNWMLEAMDAFCRVHKIPRIVPYSLRGMESSLRVEIAADRQAYDAEFKRGLAKDKGHGDFGVTYDHYINDAAKGHAHESEVRQRQQVIERAQQLSELREGIMAEALQRAQQQGMGPIQILDVLRAAEQEFEARRGELEQALQRAN